MVSLNETIWYRIEIIRNPEVGWIPVRILLDTYDPIGNGYAQEEVWYMYVDSAKNDASRLRKRLEHDGVDAEVRVVKSTTTTEVVEEY